MKRTIFPAALLAVLALPTVQPVASPAGGAVTLIPHRAIYEMQLADPGSGGIEDITGRLVFEITGNACEGYVMNTRFVLNTTLNADRTILNDFQSTTFEDPRNDAFRFISKDFVDNELSEEINGSAGRVDGDVEVKLKSPEEKTVRLDGDARFPVQHIEELIAVALKNEQVFQSQLFDGTDGGEKVYATTAIIGEALPPDEFGKETTPVDEVLTDAVRWPIVMSYFDETSENAEEGLPIYQMSFQLYENGVTRSLELDYGEFKLEGRMSLFELLEAAACE